MYIGSVLRFLYKGFLLFNRYFSGYLILFLLFCLIFFKKNVLNRNHNIISEKTQLSEKLSRIDSKKEPKQGWVIFLCFLIALTIALTFSLCPINGQSAGIDSSVFLYIGKRMQSGAVPYRDLFDHKGPLLFFIQYFGLLFSGDKFFGVWIIELVCLTVAIYFSYKTLQILNNKNTVINFLTILLSYLVIGLQLFEGGNLTEEYALPAIAFFGYVFSKFLKTGECTRWETFGAGLGFMAVCLIRINMIGFWMMGLPIIVGVLVLKRQSKKILWYMFWFIMGSLIVLLPCLIYLLLTNSLVNMWKYYFVFNSDYAKNYGGGGIGSLNQLKSIFFFMKLVWPATLAIIIYTLAWLKRGFNKIFKRCVVGVKKDELIRLTCLAIFGFTLSLATMSAKNFLHYIMVLIPFFAIFLQYLLIQINQYSSKIFKWQIPDDTELDYSIRGLGLVFGFFLAVTANFYILPHILTEATPDLATEYLQKTTKKDDNVLIAGNACYGYLNSGRKYSGKFFYQTPPINASKIALLDFWEDFEKNKPKVILIPYDKYNDTTKISDYLDKKTADGDYNKEILGPSETPLKVYRKK